MRSAALVATLLAAAAAASEEKACASDEFVSAATLKAAAESFRTHGFAVVEGFASKAEVQDMRETMKRMVTEWWAEESKAAEKEAEIFVTDTKGQTKAQATSRYFFDSADRIHFFREADLNATSEWGMPALNKVGHGLHLDNTTAFGAYAQSGRVAAVARKVAGLKAPVLPQSMYIFVRDKAIWRSNPSTPISLSPFASASVSLG